MRDAGLSPYLRWMEDRPAGSWEGIVVKASEQTLECEGPPCSVGENLEIVSLQGRRHPAEVIGFRGRNVIAMPVDSTRGIRHGDAVIARNSMPQIGVGDAMQGRVLDALGAPLDGLPAPDLTDRWPLEGAVPKPMDRMPIREPLEMGIRVLDGMLTVGRGQRVGIFGGSGVGKSTLIGMMTRNTAADVTVVGLVGERGREVREFVEDSLGEEGLRRSVVLVSTSDQSPLLRIRAALSTVSVAEFYASQGKNVLLILDSLTRYAMAARELGLAAGEPPTNKGYTPSVFTKLARLVERAGRFNQGSITAFYTVLMEGDDQQDPIVDAVRSFVDGHVVLSRELASEGWYPPVDVLASLSRLMPAVVSIEHRRAAMEVRRLMSIYTRSEDLVRLGAYRQGADIELDRALAAMPWIRQMLQQDSSECVLLQETVERLCGMKV